MSDLISRKYLYDKMLEKEELARQRVLDTPTHSPAYLRYVAQLNERTALKHEIADAPSVTETNVGSKWIPCSERMPEERESIFKKAKGTDKWSPGMFEGISDDINVTVEFEDGTRKTMTSHTTDGKWNCEKNYGIKMKVIAWMPLPEPYKGE